MLDIECPSGSVVNGDGILLRSLRMPREFIGEKIKMMELEHVSSTFSEVFSKVSLTIFLIPTFYPALRSYHILAP